MNCPSRTTKAFTLLEMVIVLGIIGVLAVIGFYSYQRVMAQVLQAKCTSNMRSLHTAFAAAVQDKGYWPQAPEWDDLSSARANEEWWIATMAPYTENNTEVWQCPVLKAYYRSVSGDKPKIHYTPTQFDAAPTSPFRWPKQPWLIEIADAHGAGPLILFTDGSVSSLNSVLQSASESP